MPYFICDRTCQVLMKIKGRMKPVTFETGQVVEFEKCPDHFRTLEGPVDFSTASREELLASKWTFTEANKAIQSLYGVKLTKGKDETKANIVESILDARGRNVQFKPQA